MLAESVEYILRTEYEANQVKLLVENRLKEAEEKAREEGEQSIAKSITRAEAEIEELRKTSDRRVMEAAVELASSTENRLATMRARAERRLDTVAERIFERIVSV